MSDIYLQAGERTGQFLKDTDATAKQVAKDLSAFADRLGYDKTGVSHRTVERWLQGQLPRTSHLLMLCMYFGEPFVRRVIIPLIAVPPKDDLDRQFHAVRADLRKLERQWKQLEDRAARGGLRGGDIGTGPGA